MSSKRGGKSDDGRQCRKERRKEGEREKKRRMMVKIDHTNNLKNKKKPEKTEPAVTEDRSGTEHESKSSFT